MSTEALQKLICGTVLTAPEIFQDEKTSVLAGLARLIGSYFNFSLDFRENLAAAQASYFMPVALRSLMETSSIALLGRIDPLRIIHANLAQGNPNYNKSRQQASALKWKGDITGDPIQNPIDIWNPEISPQKIPRHLLSEQYKKAFWEPAINNLFSWLTANGSTSTWLAEMQKQSTEDNYKTLIGSGNRTYSELSKGIHPEFAVKRESEFDASTLETYFEQSVKWVATLGILSHFVTGLQCGTSPSEAYSALLEVEEIFHG